MLTNLQTDNETREVSQSDVENPFGGKNVSSVCKFKKLLFHITV